MTHDASRPGKGRTPPGEWYSVRAWKQQTALPGLNMAWTLNIFHIYIFLQFQNKDVRPPFTYAALIKQVRSQSTDTAMLQQGIQLLLLLSTLSYSVASLIGFNRFARNLTWCDVRLWRPLPANSWAWTRSTPGSPTTSPSTGTTRTAGRWGTVSTLLSYIFFLSGWYGDKFSWLTNKGALGSLRNKKSTFFLQNAVRHNLSLHNMFQKVK